MLHSLAAADDAHFAILQWHQRAGRIHAELLHKIPGLFGIDDLARKQHA
jgi:hypothetical protein